MGSVWFPRQRFICFQPKVLPTCFDHDGRKTCSLPVRQGCQPSEQCRTLSYKRDNEPIELRACSNECDQEVCQSLDSVSDCTVSCCNTELCNSIEGEYGV